MMTIASDDSGDTHLTPGRVDFPVVGIGASAGGLAALQRFLTEMPSNSGMAFVIVLHLSPDHQSNAAEILAKHTGMAVQQVQAVTPIEPNHVYVIPPGHLISMDDGELTVRAAARPRGGPVTIDVFFRTLAEVHRERSVAIVLSGTGSDGALGLRRVKEMGGITMAQSPADAESNGMPLSAIDTGGVDFVLKSSAMPAKLIMLWSNARQIELPQPSSDLLVQQPATPSAAELAELALGDVMNLLRVRSGHDFRHYKRATVLRRIERRLQVNALATLPAYRDYLQANEAETALLLKDMLISVTNFFRDRDAFDALTKELPPLLQAAETQGRKLRAWVAGCATGEEAYSVAMLLAERAEVKGRRLDINVFASDIDERAIAVGRAGAYPESIASDVSPQRLRQFFTEDDGLFRVRKELRDVIVFAAHNVLRDPPFSNLDLVCCRNLLIYLERNVQLQVLEIFHYVLQPQGLLFLGSSESADAAADLFTAVDKKNRIYRANPRSVVARYAPVLPSSADKPWVALSSPRDGQLHRTPLAGLHQRLLETNGPPSVLTDAEMNILHSSPRASAFLRFADGMPSQNLLAVVRPELRLELRTALFQAGQSGRSVEARRVSLPRESSNLWVTMSVRPVTDAGSSFNLVLFDAVESSLSADLARDAAKDPVLVLLEEELQRTRDQLHGSIGQSATSTEELKASNEELQAINEELRSTTEELETSKEELQSVNEELVTLNQELKAKVEETGKVNDDLRNLIASTDIGTIFVDRSLRIKRYTPRACELFNLIPSDAGRSLLDITHRLDYELLEQDASEAFQTLRLIEREVKGPNNHTYLARVLPYRTHDDVIDGAVLSFVDISATRVAEDRMRASEAHMRMVAESTEDFAIITTDVAGKVSAWNIGAKHVFGYEESEILGQTLDVIFTADDRARGIPDDERRRAREDGRASDERWHLRKDGSTFYCSGIMTALHEGGELKGYAKIARDLTDSKRAEAQREEMLVQETAVRSELQASSVMKDEFLAVMSHELKHPLNLIHVNAELLSRLPEVRNVPSVASATDIIRRTVLNQAKIVDDLLDLSRMHTGKLTLHPAPIEWVPILERVTAAVGDDAFKAGLTLELQADSAASPICADPVRVEQVVWNLISNALKFTPSGGRVQVELSLDGAAARLDVSDNGIGIEPAFIDHVFDMFRQAGPSTTRKQGGMGIGLALVKQLIEEQGGRVAVNSDGAGRGSRFSVWLPLQEPHDDPHAASQDDAIAGVRILLVDDTVDTLTAFGMLLEMDGAQVQTASSGQQALELLAQQDFDILLSDVAMPGMDGYELVEQLRKAPRTARLPAVAMTGFGRADDVRRALEVGFDAHLSKPVGLEDVTKVVTGLVRRKKRGR